jgi:hypothetical protein
VVRKLGSLKFERKLVLKLLMDGEMEKKKRRAGTGEGRGFKYYLGPPSAELSADTGFLQIAMELRDLIKSHDKSRWW